MDFHGSVISWFPASENEEFGLFIFDGQPASVKVVEDVVYYYVKSREDVTMSLGVIQDLDVVRIDFALVPSSPDVREKDREECRRGRGALGEAFVYGETRANCPSSFWGDMSVRHEGSGPSLLCGGSLLRGRCPTIVSCLP